MMSDRKVAIQYNKKPVNWKHVVLHIVLLCVCVISMFPFIWMISSSLKIHSSLRRPWSLVMVCRKRATLPVLSLP